jgi:cytochrome c553
MKTGDEPPRGRPLRRIVLAVAVACVACERTADMPPAAPASHAASPPISLSARMHAQLAAIREIHLALLHGDLEAARDRARALSRISAAGEPGVWQEPVRFVREQALRLASASDARHARHLSTELATVCADCHLVHARSVRFDPPPRPADDGSLRGAMARHQWAADSMWIGLVAPSTDLWLEGLDAIAALPVSSRAFAGYENPAELEQQRRRLLALTARSRMLPGQGDRARRLGQMMEVCADCHAIDRRQRRRLDR